MKRLIKSIVCFILIGILFIGSLVTSMNATSVTVYADSTDRIKTFIQLAKDGSITSGDANSLTEDQLRFLGIYLSNFYIPFVTEFGAGGSESLKTTKSDMIECLKQKLAFSDELAERLVDIIFGYARGSTTELSLYVSTDYYNGDYKKVPFIQPNYINFLLLMYGRADAVFERYGWDGEDSPFDSSDDTELDSKIRKALNAECWNDKTWGDEDLCSEAVELGGWDGIHIIRDIIRHRLKYFYFGYEDDDGNLVFAADGYIPHNGFKGSDDPNTILVGEDWGGWGSNNDKAYSAESILTVSQIAFIKCLESADIKMGFGFNLLDFTTLDGADYDYIADELTEEMMLAMSNFETKIAVDCFGDLISMGGNHQTVIMPGSINPYTWRGVATDGSDIDSIKPGMTFVLANGISMYQAGIHKFNHFKEGTTAPVFEFDGMNKAVWQIEQTTEIDGHEFKYKDLLPCFDIFNDGIDSIQEGWSLNNSIANDKACVPAFVSRGSKQVKLNTGDCLSFNNSKTAASRVLSGAISEYRRKYKVDNTYRYTSWSVAWDSGWVTNDTTTYDLAVPRSQSADEENSAGADYCFGLSADDIDKNYYNDKVVLFDTLGAYKSTDGFNQFIVVSFLNDYGIPGSKKLDYKSKNFSSLYNSIKSGSLNIPYSISESTLSSLYVTYCFATLYTDENKSETIGALGFRFNKEGLPNMSNGILDLSDLIDYSSLKKEQSTIMHWTYYLMHPTEGFQYVVTLIRNKVNHLLLGWHYDMTGTNGVGVNTGTTKYRSTMGYVTMPDLSEIEWTNNLVKFYEDCIPFLIILLIIIMVFAFVTKAVGAQQAIVGILLFSLFTLLPINIINATVEESNRISQNIYGEKFTYWALVQQESYAQAIDDAANGDSYENYLRTLYSENEAVYSNQGGNSILLKWQAPKKMASLVLSKSDADKTSGLGDLGNRMLRNMSGRAFSGESFLDDDSVYLYRNYTDISNFSRYIYRSISAQRTNEISVEYQGVVPFGSISKSANPRNISTDEVVNNWYAFNKLRLQGSQSNIDFPTMYTNYIKNGYANGTNLASTESEDIKDAFYLTVPLSSKIIDDTIQNLNTTKISTYSNTNNLVPINQDLFNFGIPNFNGGTKRSSDANGDPFALSYLSATGGIEIGSQRYTNLKNAKSKYKESDFTGLAAYGLYSENPYYYFSWKLFADGMNCNSALTSGKYKDILLNKENGGYFYNTKGNGELKDFMNMKGLFYYVIPYMKQLNDYVREWDDVFGVFTYEGVPTEEGHWADVQGDPELTAKYWHNLNVARLYMIYCPWVDVMYDCSYAKAETITVLGERVTIDDPINPYSYPEDRPMIFSRSEMLDYGLGEGDLTSVEKKILSCNDQFQDRLYELLNYYTFSDISLNSAAAINCAFVFNNTFSESGIFTDNHNIYPQAFDIANFSYDAFLRLALANGTGENLLNSTGSDGTYAGSTTGDFYERIVNNSSILTVIIMLILDIVSIYVIPAIRIFFLLALFVSVIMLTLVAALKIEENLKFVRKMLSRFIIPLILFFVTTIAFSFLLSFFMGSPANSVTKTKQFNISLGDPVMTMLAMLAMDILLIVIYWKIIKGILKDLKERAGQLKSFGVGLGSAAVGFVGGLATAGVSGVHKIRTEASEFGRDMRSRKDSKNLKKSADAANSGSDEDEKPAQEGTGVENGRANSRGSNGRSKSSETRTSRDKDSRTEKPGLSEENVRREKISRTRRDEIDQKASEGSENLKDKYNKQKEEYDSERRKRYSKSGKKIQGKYGYAKDDDGNFDPTKLTRHDQKSYNRKVNRRFNFEDRKYNKENRKLSKMVSNTNQKEDKSAKKTFKVQKKNTKNANSNN